MLALVVSTLTYTPSAAKQRLRDSFGARTDGVLACPKSKALLQSEVSVVGGELRALLTSTLGERYPVRSASSSDGEAVYADLIPREQRLGLGELGQQLRDEAFSVLSMQTGIFRSPLMAWYYERGWRQNFEAAGFPGIDKEFAELSAFFAGAGDGSTVVDLSCGSGLMCRRLVKSGRYGRVLALDYSEEMLRQTWSRFDQEAIPTTTLTLVRADAGALPLRTGGVDGLHAGAALHCWPELEQSLAEVKRVLRPDGGRFFATTFFEGAVPGQRAQGQQPGVGSMRFFRDERELEHLLVEAGFEAEKVEVRREGRACAVIRAEV